MAIHFVTGNIGKFTQVEEALWSFVDLVQVDLHIPEIQTTSIRDISADKARQSFAQVGKPVLVEDSGIYFDAFPDFPGALTKFIYQGIGLEGIRRLFAGEENTKAMFQCVLSYMDGKHIDPVQFVWEVSGRLVFTYLKDHEEDPRLPYDLIFVADGLESPVLFHMEQWKSELSHRVIATKQLKEWIEVHPDLKD